MNKLFELGDRFAAQSTWKDFALTKFCLCAMGVLIGSFLPAKQDKRVRMIAGAVFVSTYVILMRKVLGILKEMKA